MSMSQTRVRSTTVERVQLTDSELVERYLDGEEMRLRELVESYQGLSVNIIKRSIGYS